MKTVRWTVLAVLAIAALVAVAWWREQPSLERGSTLVVTLEGEYAEAPETPILGELFGVSRRPLIATLSELRKAERDERIERVVLVVRNLQVGWAKAQELRDAVRALRDAGRHPTAVLEVEGFGANREYYVACAAEKLYLAPGSGPPLIGLAEEHLFLGGLWERYGISMQVAQAGIYKGAVDSLVDQAMSEPYREQAEWLLDSLDGQFVAGIAEARGVPVQTVRQAIATAPSQPEVLEELGLIDGTRTRRDLLADVDDELEIDASDYAAVDAADVGFDPQASFALVYGSGAIQSGRGSVSPSGRIVFASETVIEAIEQAAEDEEIAAIILRVDSPGGSAFPSEQVWQALRRARESKPVVASFSDYAASGGYYLASAADAIVAEPGTLTGSIGVFAVRPGLGGLFERFAVNAATMERGPHAEINLMTPSLSPDTRDWLQSDVEGVYGRFLDRVAEGRERSLDEIRAVAGGRVWTGEQAVTRGLVDALGGLRTAVARAKAKAGIEADADVSLTIYPPPKPFAVQLRELLRIEVGRGLASALPWGVVTARAGAWLDAVSGPGPVLAPMLWIDIQ